MNNAAPFYLQKLRSEFDAKTKRNAKYSLRAFARFLEIEPPALSAILKGQRGIPKNKISSVINKLSLSPKEAAAFKATNLNRKEIFKGSLSELDFTLNEELHFNVIAEWEYYAILSLTETKGFKNNVPWIAERLGLTEYRAQVCLENLIEIGLLKKTKFGVKLANSGTQTTEDVASRALKKSMKQDLEISEKAIDDIDVELRDLSSITFTLNKKDLPDIKKDIRNFRKKLAKKAESKKGEEVYKLSVQLVPLTKIKNNQGEQS